ncbi:MmgE/PrpD family protein [Brucella thiophenivorans]|uniref:MmgE/PrpD family protein n=1 Tax=Brucella thiophenivorans TaxID=571255 RepID=A0A256G1E9_9HYPH|nr:MmgE/PrpD family protein [Brucella thiophenivorans]OYR20902.1 mmgE/PrpD family protein [Brucella thiophenivorans]
MTKIESIVDYTLRADYDSLSDLSKEQLPVHILDSIGCQIAALGAGPVNACRNVVTAMAPTGSVALIGGGQSTPAYAAFWHTALVRYVDAMDNILAPTETAHTADNFGGVLTAALIADASGKDLMLGAAIGWSIQSYLVEQGNFMTRGFDHTTQLAFSVTAAAGRLLKMKKQQIAHAIAMAAASDASFAGIRAKPLSQWKGLASAQSTLGLFNALYLAKEGVEGPLAIVEGPNGIENLLGRPLDIDWANAKYEGIATATIKKYVAMIHTQAAVECIMCLIKEKNVDAKNISAIHADVPQITFDFAGGGLYGKAHENITSKEQADHSLPYLLAVAALDREVMQPQFEQSRITRDDVQGLLNRVTISVDDDFTKRYPKDFCARVNITLNDGSKVTHEVSNYPGMPSHPFTWQDSVDKFDMLTEGNISSSLSTDVKQIVKELENHTTKDLFAILSKVGS